MASGDGLELDALLEEARAADDEVTESVRKINGAIKVLYESATELGAQLTAATLAHVADRMADTFFEFAIGIHRIETGYVKTQNRFIGVFEKIMVFLTRHSDDEEISSAEALQRAGNVYASLVTCVADLKRFRDSIQAMEPMSDRFLQARDAAASALESMISEFNDGIRTMAGVSERLA